jgi:hypothetical protein
MSRFESLVEIFSSILTIRIASSRFQHLVQRHRRPRHVRSRVLVSNLQLVERLCTAWFIR